MLVLEPIEHYYKWLVSKVDYGDISVYHSRLLSDINFKNFIWILKKDENRAKDGLELRREYASEPDTPLEFTPILFESDTCSFLEMLIAMSERFCFNVIGRGVMQPQEWFWQMILNAGLMPYDDLNYDKESVNQILDAILTRDYQPNGFGGLFPLQNTKVDQRKVEIWYQQSEWWEENRYRR